MNKRCKSLFGECREDGWFFDLELLAMAKHKGFVIKEIPIHWEEFYYKNRESKLRVFRDGVLSVVAMFRIRNHVIKM